MINTTFVIYNKNSFPIFWEKQSEIKKFPSFDISSCKVVERYDYAYQYQITYNYPFKGSKEMYNPLVYLGTDLTPLSINEKLAPLLSEEYSIFQIDNGYVCNEYLIGGQNNIIIDIFNPHYNAVNYENINKRKISTLKGFKYVLFVPHTYSYLFGHYFSDGIMGYLNVPQWIWDLNPVIVQSNFHDLLREHLKAFGQNNVTIISSYGKFIYGEHVFVCANRDVYFGYGIHSLPILRDKFYKYYNLYEIKPEKYGYMNKKRGQRHFINLDTIMSNIGKAKGLIFEKHEVNKPNMIEFYKILASMRLFLCPAGSIAFNVVFLQDGQGFISLNANAIDAPNLKLCRDLHIWQISVIHQNMLHYGKSGYGNEAKISVSIDIVLYAIENKKWPPDHKLFVSFDYDKINETYQTNKSMRYTEIVHNLIAEYAKHVDIKALQI